MPIASILGLIIGASELGLGVFKRARKSDTADADRGSLRVLWVVILSAIALAAALSVLAPAGGFVMPTALLAAAIGVFVAGLVLRWYAIVYLGRFFTVSVAIAADHQVIDTGPYRQVRHPSYTGILLEFIGLGVAFGNWLSLLVLMFAVVPAFLWRMRVEEAALSRALGPRYRDYAQRTKRLVPFLY